MKVWASVNKLVLNLVKTKEIVFKRPRALHFHMPPVLEEIEQLHCVKLFGVLFQDKLKMDSHIQYFLSQWAQRMYLLKLLQHQGMPLNKLRVVVYSLIVSRIRYALPALDLYLLNLMIARLMLCLSGSRGMAIQRITLHCQTC